MLTIKVFGPGCANCRKLEEIATQALADAGVEGEIAQGDGHAGRSSPPSVFKTPGLSINGKLV